jgi:hypothetical protein
MITNMTLGRNQDGSGYLNLPKDAYEAFLTGTPLTKISGDCNGEFRIELRLTRPAPITLAYKGYEASWDGKCYRVTSPTGVLWLSEDGCVWKYKNGHDVDSDEFRGCSIHLRGGPQNGETVS